MTPMGEAEVVKVVITDETEWVYSHKQLSCGDLSILLLRKYIVFGDVYVTPMGEAEVVKVVITDETEWVYSNTQLSCKYILLRKYVVVGKYM